jgi:hypothetical protein
LNGLEDVSFIETPHENEQIKSNENIPNILLIKDENQSRKIFSYTSEHKIRQREDASALS